MIIKLCMCIENILSFGYIIYNYTYRKADTENDAVNYRQPVGYQS
jgi:hypothetical protein